MLFMISMDFLLIQRRVVGSSGMDFHILEGYFKFVLEFRQSVITKFIMSCLLLKHEKSALWLGVFSPRDTLGLGSRFVCVIR